MTRIASWVAICLLGVWLAASGFGLRALAQTDPTLPPVVPVQTSPPNADGSVVHIVQPGQTLWDLAVVYGVPLDDLLFINGLARGVTLLPGQTIIVRLADGQLPPAIHVVQEGESLWSIAAQHGLTLDELLALNDLQRGAIVKPGDELLIRPLDPTPTPAPTPIPVTLPPTETLSPSPTDPPAVSLTPTPPFEPATASPTVPPTVTATVSLAVTPSPVPTGTPLPSSPVRSPASDRAGEARMILIMAMILIAGLGGMLVVGGLLVVWRSRR